MLVPALLAALALQNAPAPAPAPPVPPAQRPKLLERPSIRPTRSGDARHNHAQAVDPQPALPAPAAAASGEISPDGASAAAAGVEGTESAAATQEPAADDRSPVRIAPSAVAAPSAPAQAAPGMAPAARPAFPIGKLVPVAALAILAGPALGAIWFLGRTRPGTGAG